MEAQVEAYCGLMGGGKSYSCVERITQYLAVGGCVYTDIDLAIDPWYDERYKVQRKGLRHFLKSRYRWDLQDGQYVKIPHDDVYRLSEIVPQGTVERPVLVVLDETLDNLDSLDRGESVKRLREFLSFIRHCRKFCVDLIFIAQEFTQLHNRVRGVCSSIYLCRDMAKTELPGLGMRVPWPWSMYIVVQQMDRRCKIPYRRSWLPKDDGIFGCYRTSELFRQFNLIDARTDFRGAGKKNKEVHMFWKVACVVGCMASLACVFMVARVMRRPVPVAPIVVQGAGAVGSNGVSIAHKTVRPEVEFEFDRIGIVQRPGLPIEAIASGVRYWKGRMCDKGLVEGVTSENVLFRRLDGGRLILVNADVKKMSPQDVEDRKQREVERVDESEAKEKGQGDTPSMLARLGK